MLQGDGDGKLRETVQKISGAIQGINNPLVLGAAIFCRYFTVLLGENTVVWKSFLQALEMRLPARRAARIAILSVGCMGTRVSL